MIQITAEQVTPAIRTLFRTDEMQAKRCFEVLDGVSGSGKILVDNLASPRWGLVQEAMDHDLFLGGQIDAPVFEEVFAALRKEGEVLVGIPADDPRISLLPPNPYYDGFTLEYYDRPLGEGLEPILRQVPADCRIQRLDRSLILRTEWGPEDVRLHGGLDQWGKTCFGYVLMRGDEILSEATVGPCALGLYEPGVFTQPDQRGKGYGTLVTAHLIQEIESNGCQTYWNCAKQNSASAAIARKLGYRIEKEFRCLAWAKTV